MADPVLAIGDLCVTLHRDGRASRVLDGLTLDVGAGEIVALVGESGSGKSTLGLALQGLLPADGRPLVAGSIRIASTDLIGAGERALRGARRSLVRAVPQDAMAGLNPTMTVRRQLAESTGDAGLVIDWLARTGLADPARIAESYPHRLSGGQRQRVLIAMAMLARPRVLVADEPTTALDVTTQAQILDLLRQLAREQQTSILFITHDLAVAATLADRIAVLHGGRIAELGPTRSVINAPKHAYTHRLLAARLHIDSDRPPATPIGGNIALRLSAVAKTYPTGERTVWGRRRQQYVLKAFDLSLWQGECLALVGESGAGKSTILRLSAGLVAPDSGQVFRADPQPQMVYQDPASALTPWLSIGEQIGERVRAEDRPSRVREALKLVGLDPALATVLPGELSLGQCQRAVLARAVIVPPKLLLCDEPVSAMDVPLATTILDLLGILRRQFGIAMLFVTHDLAAARRVADRIAVLRNGELVEIADADTLLAAPAHAYTRALIDAVPRLESAR